ncbi:hypothetical protein GOV04_05215 [Candidatus Woesearchaeota archaeon]|nr:hypothetical protein [Candidatus Woesearchaeota archaeon]
MIDIIWPVLVMFGVEKVAYNAAANPFLRVEYTFYPISHSLIMTLLYAVLVFFLFHKLKNKTWALALSIAVASHWFLDLITHVPDLPILLTSKVGLGLWQYPKGWFRTEVIFFGIATYFVLDSNKDKSFRIWMFSGYILMIMLFLFMFFAPAITPTNLQLGLTTLLVMAILPTFAYFAEKKGRKK